MVAAPRRSLAARLNTLRAAVLGSNDGIVSVAGTLTGMTGATHALPLILIPGFIAVTAGAFSMGQGEYSSVSTQRDAEKVAIASGDTTITGADLVDPWAAARSSWASFLCGAAIPMGAVAATPAAWRTLAVFAGCLVALAVTGYWSARQSGAQPLRPTLRVLAGGTLTMTMTFAVGIVAHHLFGRLAGLN